MANPMYKWHLTIGGETYDVHPVYKDDMTLDYELESGQRFFRRKLGSKIAFVGADADRIITAAFTTEFVLDLLVSYDFGLTYSQYYRSHFYKTDCIINVDDAKVSVQPSPLDQYNDILAGMDKEFNLIELAPAIQPVMAVKRPMFQLYIVDDNVVTCLCGGNSFERDVVDGSAEKAEQCHFAPFDTYWEINLPGISVPELAHPFAGQYNGNGSVFTCIDPTYRIEYFETIDGSLNHTNGLIIIKNSDDSEFARFEQNIQTAIPDYFLTIPTSFRFTDGTNSYPATKVVYEGFYGRLVLDNATLQYGGNVIDCYKIQGDDMVSTNRNYRYCIGFRAFQYQASVRTSTTPTKWGRTDNGDYFLPPDDTQEWFPIGRSRWVNTSLWVLYDSVVSGYELQGRHQFAIKDTYPLWSVLDVLLKQVAPDITFAPTSAYSDFFYGNRLPSAMQGAQLFLSPKSNVILGEYQEPAMKAPVTLGDVLTMLRRVFNCYWFVDSNLRLRIEHIRWFMNGGTYSSTHGIGYDLTMMENMRNGKRWAFCTSEYQYDKEDMPERYQYEWMDEVTELFKGYPINVLSPFVQQGKVEEVTVANFTSDIDYMLMASELCSKDGFALLMAERSGSTWSLPFLSTQHPESPYTYSLQNWMLAFYWLQEFFLVYNMPAWTLEVNYAAATAASVQRGKKQQVIIPIAATEPDTFQLVKTNMGEGEYEKINITLASRIAKATLKYDTYDNE